jgi:hypothetical protein
MSWSWTPPPSITATTGLKGSSADHGRFAELLMSSGPADDSVYEAMALEYVNAGSVGRRATTAT